jgi:iron complex transport system permease protein
MTPLKRAAILLLSLTALAFACALLALSSGSVPTELRTVWQVFTGHEHGLSYELVMQLRLPRTVNAFTTGAMLALAGTLMQVLLRNPLADPYVLGISGGAAVAALGAMLLGIGGAWLNGAAFVGAMLSMLLVFGLARGAGAWSSTRLLLTGVIVAAGWGAAISFLLTVSPDAKLRGMLFWMMGDLDNAQGYGPGVVGLAAGLLLSLPLARSLNVMARGELTARSLGVPVAGLRIHLYMVASLLTAIAVMTAGSIGFIGLVAPHMLRLVVGNDHRILLPGAALFGGSLLMLADTLARTALAPQQLPVGIVTALLGVPLFLYLLARAQRQ